MKKLNLGCGRDIKNGYVNLDVINMPGVDVVTDINKPLPFSDNFFDEIYASHIIEHVHDLESVLRELHRIAKNNSKIIILVPHFSFFCAYRDPTHKHFFSYFTFNYFTDNWDYNYYSNLRFKILKKRIHFYLLKNKKIEIDFYPMTWFANLFPLFYERFLCWIFPAHEIYFELRPIK